MGHKRRHLKNQVRDLDYSEGYSDYRSTRYQQALAEIDNANREPEICWNQLLGER